MGQTLTHGIYLPDEGERNCYSGLAANWQILDGSVGTIAAHTAALAGKAPLVHTHTKSDITDFPVYGTTAGTICEGNDSRLSDARTPLAHTHTKSDVTDLFNSGNTWSGNQIYTGMVILNSSSDVAEQFRQKLPKDVSTSSDALVRFNTLADSAGHYIVTNIEGHWASYAAKSTTLKYKNDSTKTGTIEFRLDSSGRGLFYPQSPFECDLGNSSNQWKSVYAQSYYYNGTAWGLDKENVWSANQKITNNPSYLYFKNTSMTMGTAPASNKYSGVIFQDSNDTELGNITYKKHKNNNNYLILSAKNTDGTNNYECLINLSITPAGNATFYPEGMNCYLGTSNNPWKTLNGINPGALSLPDLTSNGYINLSDNISANTEYSYTPPADGWLALYVLTTGFHVENAVGIFNGSSSGNAHRLACSATSGINLARSNYYHGAVILPVIAGIPYLCWIKIDSSTTLASKVLYFYKAAGNV